LNIHGTGEQEDGAYLCFLTRRGDDYRASPLLHLAVELLTIFEVAIVSCSLQPGYCVIC
jgi:hypothetical protein